MQLNVNLPEVVGKGYGSFWRSKHRYLVVKGGRASKKSTTAALKIIYNIMKYPDAHALVVRRYDVDHKDSTYAQLKWAIHRLKVSHLWKAGVSPMKLTYKPTGQTILFRGLDDPQSIASIVVEQGHICWVWIEEAFQVMKEETFDRLDLSIRGDLPPGLFKQFIITFNPWNENHWLKERFFDEPDELTYTMTTTFEQNEWLGEDDQLIFEMLRKRFPGRFQVEGMGDWGITKGLIYAQFAYDNKAYLIKDEDVPKLFTKLIIGIDWGDAASAHSFTATGITGEYTGMIALCTEKHEAEHLTPAQLEKLVVGFVKRVIAEYGAVDMIFCDHVNTFINGCREALKAAKINVPITHAAKPEIVERITLVQKLMAFMKFRMTRHCRTLQDALNTAIYDPKNTEKAVAKRLDDGTSDIDSIDSFEYSFTMFIELFQHNMMRDLTND